MKTNKDTERLNFLEKHKIGLNVPNTMNGKAHTWFEKDFQVFHYEGNTYRQAIDNAMKGMNELTTAASN